LVIPAKSRGLSGEASAKTEAGCEPGSRMFLIICYFPGFPFGFAQGGEYVEPRVSPGMTVF
jgi:hypothetical protein